MTNITRLGQGKCPKCDEEGTLWQDGMHLCENCGSVRGPMNGSKEWEKPVLYDKKHSEDDTNKDAKED